MDAIARLDRLGHEAAALVEAGMTVGLGSGSTAEAFVRALGKRVEHGLPVTGVATSHRTERLARDLGIPIDPLDAVRRIDLGVDGADEIDPGLAVVKGRGGALLYEKLVARACDRYLIIASDEKLVDRLGARLPLPVEVVPFGWTHTRAALESLGCHPVLRSRSPDGADAPYLTEGGHFILDCRTGEIDDAWGLAAALKATVGVVEHGLFLDFADQAMVVDAHGRIRSIGRP